MKNPKVKKNLITFICLCFYVIFSFISLGNVSICFGCEHSRHIGLNYFGIEKCCNENINTTSNKTFSSNSNVIYAPCCCEDVNLSSNTMSISHFDINYNFVNNIILYIQRIRVNTAISYTIEYADKFVFKDISPHNIFLQKNLNSLNSTILVI